MGFDFNLPNFGLGFGAGALTTAAGMQLWRWRQRQLDERPPASFNIESGKSIQSVYATRSGEKRYLNHLVRMCQAHHLAGNRIALSEILVEPTFILPEEPMPAQNDEEDETSIFEHVPRTYDFPYLLAPYNVPTLSIDDLGRGDRALVMIGEPGSGRTTALLSIALWSLGRIDFASAPDIVQKQLDAEEQQLSSEDRANRIRQHLEAAQAARERIAVQAGREVEQIQAVQTSYRDFVPLYVHLNDVLVKTGGYGATIDPAEPLVRALQAQVPTFTARTMPRGIYKLLASGRALVLVDGLDDVPSAEQAEKWAWLRAFKEMYGANVIILTAPPTGYQPALAAGFTPIYLRPWNDTHIATCADKWAQHWHTISGSSQSVGATVKQRMKTTNRSRSPYEITLRMWSEYAGETDSNHSAHITAYLRRLLRDADTLLPQLQRLAQMQLDEGFITIERLVMLTAPEGTPAPVQVESTAENITDDETEISAETTADEKPTREDQESAQRRSQIVREQTRLLNRLVKVGLLIKYRGERYQFRQQLVAAHLASLTLKDASEDTLLDKTRLPAWRMALAFANQHQDMSLAIRALMAQSPDVLLSSLLEISRWVKYAGKTANWRGRFFQAVGNLFVAPNQYLVVRERIAAALVSSGDEGALAIFRRGLRSDEPDVRKLSALAVGAMRDDGALQLLNDLFYDPYADIQVAAAMALGAINTDAALELLAEQLETSPQKDVRRAIAEMLAADPENGYPTLYAALSAGEDDDDAIQLRRAAIFGLGRVRTDWALVALNQVLLKPDEQYFVRLAAEIVLEDIYIKSHQNLQVGYSVAHLPWLREWYEQFGMPGARNDTERLAQAIEQTANPEIQLRALAAAGQLAQIEVLRSVYAALTHPESSIRDTACRTLAQFQIVTGQPLPAPAQ